AMMLAKPVIGTEGTSFEELIKDGENGFLAKPGDANSLKEVISMAWRRNDLAKMGNAAKQKTEEFAPEHTIGELVTYFNSIIKKNDLKS
ncbi:MAG: glycosyltransferase, partial [Candidatus Omnitrophica bacterium]|nr:glycosyltransferase [Candidatus Omnitrophota bacterium]